MEFNKIDRAVNYLHFLFNHYNEQLYSSIEDSYFVSDDLRKAYILSIKSYLQVLLDILEN